MIELPKTIRPAKEHEIPSGSAALERLNLLGEANIVEGYKIIDNIKTKENQEEVLFNFYAEINIDNSKLWNLLMNLTDELPEETSSLIYGHSDCDIEFSEYQSKNELIQKIKRFEIELTQDTFIHWGMIYSDEEKLVELFVDESKYVKFWGINLNSFKETMLKLGLNEVNDLEFIDEYPKVREPLTKHRKECLNSEELINALREI
jgi:hypothetical protein